MYAAPLLVSAERRKLYKKRLSAEPQRQRVSLRQVKHAKRQNVSLTGAKQKIFRF